MRVGRLNRDDYTKHEKVMNPYNPIHIEDLRSSNRKRGCFCMAYEAEIFKCSMGIFCLKET